MIPGMNPKKMEKMMKQLGMKQEEIDANEVIIKCSDKEIVVRNPQVSKVNMMGQETLQISGDMEERELEVFNEEDVKTVSEQANVSEDEAKAALKETGDIAEAILKLK
tara:strand:- start:102 stop:425 length:324 start_codon:yes stop_codon:yes gene_type:complete